MIILAQSIFSFVILLILTRWIGKQQVSQLTYYEYINGITFGSIAANMATDEIDKLGDHFIGLATYGVLTVLIGVIALRSRSMRKIIVGEPVVVIQDGKILEENLKKMKMNMDELIMLLRLKDIFDFTEVKLAIIEQSGGLSVIRKSQYDTPQRKDLHIHTQGESLAVDVIQEGKLVGDNLQRLGLSQNWLIEQLSKRGVNDISQVMYAAIDGQNRLLLDLRADQISSPINLSDGTEHFLR